MAQNRPQELLGDLDYRIAVTRQADDIVALLAELKPGEEIEINLESSSVDGGSAGLVRLSRPLRH